MTRAILFMAVIGVMAVSASATGTASKANRALKNAQGQNLYTECAPMGLLVDTLDREAWGMHDLRVEAITNTIESRLRSARIYASIDEQAEDPRTRGREQSLYVDIRTGARVFLVELQLYRGVKDFGYGRPGFAVAWTQGAAGLHDGNAHVILGAVAARVDSFIVEYLRVNESSCS